MSESLALRSRLAIDAGLWGVRSPFSSRQTRATFVVAAVLLGIVLYRLLSIVLAPTAAIVLLAAWAAAPPALSKTATAWD